MGFRFRKTFGKGPFKMTVSKSGIGYSVGGKGFRVTKKAGGGTRTTASIPGTGISYTTDSKKKKSGKSSNKAANTTQKSASSSGSGGCLTSCLWILGACLVIGLIAKYWKILLAVAIAVVAVYIGLKVYRKNNPKEIPEEDPSVPVAEIPEPSKPESEVKAYQAAGVCYYLDALLSMMEPNYLYGYKKQELIDCCSYEENIYKQTVTVDKIELVPEPDNPHNPNAIKIMLNDKLVGYIPAVDCPHLLEVLNDDRIVNIHCEVSGGKYKRVNEDYDFDKDRSTYRMETGEDDYGITLYIREKN